MRCVTAHFIFEANTFCPRLAGIGLFRDGGTWLEGEPAVRAWCGEAATQTAGALGALEAAGWTCAPVVAVTCGSPSGRLSRACWDEIRSALLANIARALPADAVILHLHGAACAEGVDDCEGDLIAAVRDELSFVGRLVISLDLHANATRVMVERADAITAYRTMPHTDFVATGARAARLAMDPRPTVRALAKIAALIPPIDTSDREGRFAAMLERARAAEGGEIDEICLLPVQPWLDIAEPGSAVVVTGRGAAPARVARELASLWWAQRHDWRAGTGDWPTIIARLRAGRPASGSPWVLVDAADATTGGSEGDSAEALARLLPHAHDLPGDVLIGVVDPAAVAAAMAIGAGGRGRFVIGRQRIELEAEVLALGDGDYRSESALYTGARCAIGRAAVLAVARLRILVHCQPSMIMDPGYYRALGLDAASALAVLSKSIMSWRAAFAAPAAHGLYFNGPGCTPLDLRTLPWPGPGRACFPIDPDPAEPIRVSTFGD